jgi:uncharacterized C2H2 Zn-finger protein
MEPPEELPEGLPECIKSWVIKRTGKRKYECKLCHMEIVNTEQLRFHLRNGYHIKKVMQQTALHCDLCNLQCKYQSVYDKHIKSKAHLQKENPQPKVIIDYKCEDCKITFQSNKDKLRHLTTKKHAKLAKTDSVSSNP